MVSLASAVLPSSGNWNSLARTQLEILQTLVKKHLQHGKVTVGEITRQDPGLTEIASATDFAVTTTERGIPRYEHSHLVAALDVLLEYQRNRKTTYFKVMGTRAQTSLAPYRHDPRTRLIELLKRWLRSNAANANLSEEDVRRMCALCRDLLNYPNLFPSRNKTSFMHALSEAYEHLELQLRQVLERDRTCAELAARCLSLSRNLVSDAITFLLLAATHLTQTDNLPSLEVVVLWQSLPAAGNPLPSRADPQLQKTMQDAWSTLVGSLVTSLLGLRWTFHLFAGAGTEQELHALTASPDREAPIDMVLEQIRRVRDEFAASHFKQSGLAGPFRDPQLHEPREHLLVAVEALYDLLYLLGEVLLHFHRISDSLGDYGMIRVSLWLHPCLDSVIEKVQRLQCSLKGLSKAVDGELVIAKARGRTLKKPLPSERMASRAHAAAERALVGQDCHLSALLQALEELKTRSSPERLPHVVEGLGDACVQLQNVLTSPQFRARVGDAFPQRLPSLAYMTAGNDQRPTPQLMDTTEALGACSDPEDHEPSGPSGPSGPSPFAAEAEEHHEVADVADGSHSMCFFLFESTRRRSLSTLWSTFRALGRTTAPPALPARLTTPYPTATAATTTATTATTPTELVSELSPEGWISHTNSGGRISWHHTSLGPAPWQRPEMEDELLNAKPVSPTETPSHVSPATGTRASGASPQIRDTNPFSDQPDTQPSDTEPQPTDEAGFGMTPSTTISPRGRSPEAKQWTSFADSSPFAADVRESRPRASTMPGFLQKGCLRAEVQRLTTSVQGWKAHDSRSLLITGSQLLIYQKGSIDQVKTVVDLCEDVERCSLLSDNVLSLEVRRKRRRSSSLSRFASRSSCNSCDEVEKKLYFFRFEPQELAQQFCEIISTSRNR